MVLSDNGIESYVFPVADLNGAAKPEQSKTVNITANGTQTVTPDSGKVLSSVVINTNVPAPAVQTQEKSVEITQNGDSEVTPDAGKYLSKVNISVNVPTSTESKLPQVVDRSIITITAEDLAGATSIGASAFSGCEALESVTIPEGVTQIGVNAFHTCKSLKSITIPEGVTVINQSTFYSCTKLENASLPEGLKTISSNAFYACAFRSLIIPSSVTTIGRSAFSASGSMTWKTIITMLPTTPPSIESNSFTADKINQIIVPAGCGEAYKAATNWANFADYIVEATE